MNICFAVAQNLGLASPVCSHFSLAQDFLVVDTDTCELTAVRNNGQILKFGTCDTLEELDGQRLDAIVAGNISGALLQKLTRVDVQVFEAREGTVAENLALFREKALQQVKSPPSSHHHHGQDISP